VALRKAPVIVSIKAVQSFFDYSATTIQLYYPAENEDCDYVPTHAMLAIGFGTFGTKEYVLV
jgi:hypothetical protein